MGINVPVASASDTASSSLEKEHLRGAYVIVHMLHMPVGLPSDNSKLMMCNAGLPSANNIAVISHMLQTLGPHSISI